MADNNQRVLTPVSPRGRGRPRVSEPKLTVCTWMEAKHYDQLCRIANQREQSVSSLVKDFLLLQLK